MAPDDLQATLEATQWQILCQSPTDATFGEVAFEWELTKETINLPLGCLQGGCGGTSGWALRPLVAAAQW